MIMKIMKLISLVGLLLILFFGACDNKHSKARKQQALRDLEFSYEDAYFERITITGEFQKVPKSKYQRGERVYLFVTNIRGFGVDKKRQASILLSTAVLDPSGEEIFIEEDVLKEKGKFTSKSKVLPGVKGFFQSTVNMNRGKYTFQLQVLDMYTEEYFYIEREFYLQ